MAGPQLGLWSKLLKLGEGPASLSSCTVTHLGLLVLPPLCANTQYDSVIHVSSVSVLHASPTWPCGGRGVIEVGNYSVNR